MTKTKPTTDQFPFSCLGCGITREDIERFKLDIQFIGRGAPCLDGTDMVLPVCSRCIDNPEALTRALAREISTTIEPHRWKVIAALLTLRDKAVLGDIVARTAESAAMFAKAGETVVPWFNLAGERLDIIEHHLGLDATRPAKNQRAKNGLMGMLGGAFIGAIVGSAAKPLEALRAVINKVSEVLAEAESRNAKTGN